MAATARRAHANVLHFRGIARALGGLVSHGGAILGVVGIALIWGGVLHSRSAERAQALRGAEQDTSNLARVFEEHIVRSIKTIDQTLLYVRDSYERDRTGFDLTAWARSTQAVTDMTFQISLTDKNGILTISNFLKGDARVDLSDREHFKVQRDSPGDDIFVSKPVFGRASQQWSIQLTRKLMTANGAFDGIVVVSLSPQYFSRFYESVDLGANGVVLVAGLDGAVRANAQARGNDPALAQSLVSHLMGEYAQAQAGIFTSAREADGVTRIYAYRGVRFYPLLVCVGIAEDEVLLAHGASQTSYLVLATIMTLLLLAVTVRIIMHQARLHRTQQKLQASEAAAARKSGLLQMTLDHMSHGLMMIDAAHQVQVCNRQTVELLGLPDALMADNPAFDEVARWQFESGEFAGNLRDENSWLQRFGLVDGLFDQPQAYERTRPDGTVLEIRSTPMPGGGLVRTYTDITARKQTEARLRAARDAADRAAQARSEFLAVMSHEIRSPMSGMLGVLELLRGTRLDPDQNQMANMVQSSASALLAVLNDILDFSKIEAGSLSIFLEPANLRDLVTAIVQPHRYAVLDKGVDLTLQVSREVPDYVTTDPLRLRQMLNNLIGNAAKFTASGEIGVDVDVTRDEPSPRLRFAVRDTGIGMPADVIARLFEPFVQADSSTTRNFGGSGLGLCISRRLARLMNGSLDVTSRVNEGSVFTLLLPLIQADAAEPAGAETLTSAGADGGSPPAGLTAKGRVLVVDDDQTNRWLTRRQLEVLGLTVDAAENGEAALQMLHAGRFDLLVTDCHMPRMDGVALTRAVRAAADPALSGLPVIGLTADVTATQRERCVAAGMTDVAIKPLTLEHLSRLVVRHLAVAIPDKPAALPPPASTPPVRTSFDDHIYRQLFLPGDPDGETLLREYLELAGRLNSELQALLAVEADAALPRERVAATAHRLAGSSLSIGAARLGDAARALEQAAPGNNLAALLAHHAAVALELAAAQTAIATFLADAQQESTP